MLPDNFSYLSCNFRGKNNKISTEPRNTFAVVINCVHRKVFIEKMSSETETKNVYFYNFFGNKIKINIVTPKYKTVCA